MDHYWDAVQENVCRKCIDGDGRGNCRLAPGESCALQEVHPEVFALIGSLHATSYDAYVQVLRQKVCSVCNNQKADGTCRKRQSVECALDRYYPLVIEIAERLLEDEMMYSQPEAALQP